MNSNLKYINVAACTPSLEIGYPKGNLEKIKQLLEKHSKESDIFVFPELCITGYSCEDLFFENLLIENAKQELFRFLSGNNKNKQNKLIVLGLPIHKDNKLFNCAVYIYNGEIIGFVPKTYHTNSIENRWFSSAEERLNDELYFMGKIYPFTPNLILENVDMLLNIGVIIGNDLEYPFNLCSKHSLNGVNLILNPIAKNKIVGNSTYQRDLASIETKKNICAYVYSAASIDESTTNSVFSGQKMIVSNGKVLVEHQYDKEFCVATIDMEELNNQRCKFECLRNNKNDNSEYKYSFIKFGFTYNQDVILNVNPYPFVPNETNREKVINEILEIQSIGLAQRMKKSGIHKLVLGVSGGLDSTLALLVAVDALKRNKLPMNNLIGVTMPGFGTSNRTLNNSLRLMDLFGITQKEVSIVPACLQHFEDIGHEKDNFDVTYENVQARERTQILMDIANKESALVVGTGDLSELVLGWCTYNGDHMSMYSVNAGIPKTLIKYLVKEMANRYFWKEKTREIGKILEDICGTPVSPELLPTDKDGNMVQTTENSIGKYDLHDFFLYNMLKNGYSPYKIYHLALIAFKDMIEEEIIKNTMKIFYKRFFTQQFKRSCLPDGPKVGSISISPRGDLKMPSDACFKLWLEEIEKLD